MRWVRGSALALVLFFGIGAVADSPLPKKVGRDDGKGEVVWYPRSMAGINLLSVSEMQNGTFEIYINPKKTYQRYNLNTVAYNGKPVVETRYEVFADLEESQAATKDGMRLFIDANRLVYREFYILRGNKDLIIYSDGDGHFLVVISTVDGRVNRETTSADRP